MTETEGLRCIPYMFNYQEMELTASYSGATPASYQWIVNGEAIAGATSSTYRYTPGSLELEEDDLGNFKKVVDFSCQMEVNGEMIKAANYQVLVIQAGPAEGDGKLHPIYVMVWNEGRTELVKTAFAHVNLGAERDTDPCNCFGDLYQWGRRADGHQLRNSENYPTNDNITEESGIASISDLNSDGQITVGNIREKKFIKQFDSPFSWRPISKMNTLWGDGTLGYNQAKAIPGDPCPTGWKVPSQKFWDIALSMTSNWSWSGKGYRFAKMVHLPAGGYRKYSNGKLTEVGTLGLYWSTSSLMSSPYGAYGIDFYNGFFGSAYYNTSRATGRSVRCVESEVIDCEEITGITITGTTKFAVGSTISMTAEATPADATFVQYEWYRGPTLVGTGATYTKTNATIDDLGDYKVVAKNDCSEEVSYRTLGICTVITKATYTPCATYMFTYQTLPLEVIKTGGDGNTDYQWYVNGDAVPGETSATYNFGQGTQGLYEVYCKVSNACSTVNSNKETIEVVEAEIGKLKAITVNTINASGVKGTLEIAHVNLGAEKDTDPCFLYGDLYQWGRKDDNHQLRTSTRVTGEASGTDLNTNGQVKTGNAKYGKFIQLNSDANPDEDKDDWRSPQDNKLWDSDSSKKGTGDPCPTGWKVPSLEQLTSIFRADAIPSNEYSAGTATANTWQWVGGTNKATGYMIKRTNAGAGFVPSLFLPAGGARSHKLVNASNTDLRNVGEHGRYWTSSIRTSIRPVGDEYYYGYYFLLGTYGLGIPGVRPGHYFNAEGQSVRCIKM
ncbi:hypothetical protein D0T84_19055 [Dysgonomonas sp. 521]|uniref:FISUMP domain-containing protein n=1 Tax=Dysgonomonas sp. 521 TaxID=2302932 RepID=UPI0013D49A67|nr:FISUMP domain-containing protein [Dysgonomonas sp. 521]NDV96989.1 hypothetical protein [Dysgonomonas sp. 521]